MDLKNNSPDAVIAISKRRYVFAWALASLTAASLSSFASSYSNLGSLRALGIDIDLPTYAAQMLTDLKGIGPLLFVFIAIGFAIAFTSAGVLRRLFSPLRALVYICAGAVCLWVMFMLMEKAFFNTPIIQGARTALGLATQTLCGAIGGGLFAVLTRTYKNGPDGEHAAEDKIGLVRKAKAKSYK